MESNENGVEDPAVESAGGVDVRIAEELIARAGAEGVSLTGPEGLLASVTRQVLQTALEVQMEEHLGYEKGDREAAAAVGDGNHRNGTSPKMVLTEVGPVKVDVPRDREGSFEPRIAPQARPPRRRVRRGDRQPVCEGSRNG